MIIVIDGPAGTGKSTVARKIAKKLGFTFFDTGAMYRSFVWMIQKEQIDPTNHAAVCRLLPHFAFKVKEERTEERRYFVGEFEVTQAIREPQIARLASLVATYPEVRKTMVAIQRKLGKRCDAIFEGRDMGTVVFPKADLKIFLTASPAVRAKRRYEELFQKKSGLSLQFEQILKEIEERDHTDSSRSISPLKQAPDAHLIDTSLMSVDEVVEHILKWMSQLHLYPKMKAFYAVIYWIARIFYRVCFRLKIYGQSHLRPGLGIIVANHTSLLDPPVLAACSPEEIHFLAKDSLFKIPLLGWLIRHLNAHPVTRSAIDASMFRDLIRLLQKGKKILLFPEGTRSSDGKLQPLERGLAFLAQRGGCPIFPAYIQGTFDALPPHRKFPRLWGRISVAFGTPIEWKDFEELNKKEREQHLTERTFESFNALKAWMDTGAQGCPP